MNTEAKPKSQAARILVVDDDRLVASALRQSLEREGFIVDLANSVGDAMLHFEKEAIDVVLTDLIMPGGTGLDLLHKVEAIDPLVPVIIITADESVQPAAEAVRKRAFDYLTKPVSRLQLTATVNNAVCARRRSLARRAQQEILRREHRWLEILYKRRSEIMGVLFEKSMECIAIWDENGILVDASGSFEKLLQYLPTTAIGRDLDDFFEPHPSSGSVKNRLLALTATDAATQHWQGDVTIRRQEGRSIPGRLSLSLCDPRSAQQDDLRLQPFRPYYDDGAYESEAAMRYVVGLVQVERGHETLSLQLQRADRLATTAILAGSAAHEIKNDLGPLLGYLSLLEPLDSEGMVATMRESVRRIQLQVEQILAPLRTRVRNPGPVRLTHGVETLLDELRRAGTLRRLHLSVQCEDAEDVIVYADKDDVHQIVMNLVTNAVDALGDGKGGMRGSVSLLTCIRGDYGVLEVVDDGGGIPEESLPHVFDRFFTTKGRDGTGLGLPVVQDIVRRLRGNVSLTSQIGKGTKVTVSLPLFRPAQYHNLPELALNTPSTPLESK